MQAEDRVTPALKVAALIALCLAIGAVVVRLLEMLGMSGIVILAAILIAYLTAPVIRLLSRRMPLVWALTLTFVLIAVVIAFAFVVVVPPLVSQAQSLISSLPATIVRIHRELTDPHNEFVAKLPPSIIHYIDTLPAQLNLLAERYGLGVLQSTLGAFFSVFSLFLSLIIVPIFAAYLFFDSAELKRGFIGLVPENARPKTLAILADLNTTMGAFVRGQALDGLILALLITVMLWIMHVPYALLIGVAAGILNLIPYVGAIIGFIPSVLLALIFNGWQNALIVGVLFGVIQQIDGNVILPRVMKTSVQLSPLVIVASIIIFSAFFGVIGTFIAVPIAAMLRVLKLHFAPAPPPSEFLAEESLAAPMEVLSTTRKSGVKVAQITRSK